MWFDSGSMPFAQVHYPFENEEWFDHHFPGDFIVEYIGQTRGWFYTLHILATAIFDRPAFENCISHGIVLGSDGQKMSKSLRNYPDVREVFDRDGADAMRWFLMSLADPARRQPGRHRAGHPRRACAIVMIPLWNSWYFFQLYANAVRRRRRATTRMRRTASTDPLDRYLLAKCRQYVEQADRPRWTTTRSPTRASTTRTSSTCSPTGTSGARATGSGRDDTAGVRHPLHGARDGLPGHRAAAAADHRGGLARPDRRPVGAPGRLARSPTSCRRTTTLVAAMDKVREVCSADLGAAQGAAACATGCRSPR